MWTLLSQTKLMSKEVLVVPVDTEVEVVAAEISAGS